MRRVSPSVTTPRSIVDRSQLGRSTTIARAKTLALLGLVLVTLVGVANAQFDYPDFSSVADLNLVGTTIQAGTAIELTQAAPDQLGAMYRVDQQAVADGFETIFSFQVSNDGADGFAFLIQNDNDSALTPSAGSTLGYATAPIACYPIMELGISSSLAVEFDTWDSGPCFTEPGSARHIAVQSSGIDPNSGQWADRLGGVEFPSFPNFEDGAVHVARIVYDPTVMVLRVYLDDLDVPLFDTAVDLGSLLQTTDAWVGFTGTTGGVTSTFSILDWTYTPVVPLTYDDCISAISIAAGDALGFDNSTATNDGPDPACGAAAPNDVWFKFSPVCSGDYTISLCGGTPFDSVLAVYEGTPDCPTSVTSLLDCVNDSCGTASELTLSAAAGSTYYLQLGGNSTSDSGVGTIEVTQLTGAPGNDLCSAAETYTGPVSEGTDCANPDGIDPGCGSGTGTPDIWYEYTVTQDSLVTVSLVGSTFDTVVGIWDSCPSPGDIPLFCNNDGPGVGTASEITFSAVTGDVYLLQVTGFGGATGVASLEVSEFVAPDVTGMTVVIDGDIGGLIDSTTALESALLSAGVTPIVLTPDLPFMGTPATIYYVGGTFPNNTQLADMGLGDLIRTMILDGANAYVSGGDIWGFDPATSFDEVDGIDSAATADGADNHLRAIGVVGGPLEGLSLEYTQDSAASDWTDELVVTAADSLGPNSAAVLEDDASGGGGTGPTYLGIAYPVMTQYVTDPGSGNIVCASTEFGGYDLQPELLTAIVELLGGSITPPGDTFLRGNVNGDAAVDVSDAVFLLAALFVPGSPATTCVDASDVNDDSTADVSDAVFLLASLFVPGSPAIPLPGSVDCGVDPTMDGLDCVDAPNCP